MVNHFYKRNIEICLGYELHVTLPAALMKLKLYAWNIVLYIQERWP